MGWWGRFKHLYQIHKISFWGSAAFALKYLQIYFFFNKMEYFRELCLNSADVTLKMVVQIYNGEFYSLKWKFC